MVGIIKRLFKRYDVDIKFLILTNHQQLLLDETINKNYTFLRKFFVSSDFNVVDALAQNSQGRTVLHYLMENAGNDDAIGMPIHLHLCEMTCDLHEWQSLSNVIIEAIICVLQRSLVYPVNHNLNIFDENGQSPYHILLQNPFRHYIGIVWFFRGNEEVA